MLPLRLIATGVALPARIVTSAQLDETFNRSPGATLRHSGVQQRHVASAGETQSSLGAAALVDALRNAQLAPAAIDLLIGACGVQEQALPSTACAIAAAAALERGTPAFDVNASCLGFVAALQVAAALLSAGTAHRIAIVASDLPSRGVDWNTPHAAAIFGDGAAAAIVESGAAGQGVRGFAFATYPEGRSHCQIRAGGTLRNPRTGVQPQDYLFQMNGKAVYRLAAQVMPGLLADLLARAACSIDQLDLVVPHQASHLAMEHLSDRLGLPRERVMNIYPGHGNQVAASIPTALHTANLEGRLTPGSRLLLLGTAAGMSAGGMVLAL